MQRSVGVIIPARDDAAALPDAVRSVLQQSDVVLESIIVAVAPSSDDTREVALRLAADYPTVAVIDNPTGRTAAALNLAIAAGDSDVVVRVDARSILPREYVANALETMQQTGAANVGAMQNPVGFSPVQRSIARAMRSWAGSGGAAYRTATRRQQVDTAYLGVFDRNALIAVGGYDETFVRNQDAELNERLRRAGHEVWLDPRLIVDYQPRDSLKALASQYWQYGWWRSKNAAKHQGSLRVRQFLPPVVVLGVIASLVVSLWLPVALVVPVTYVVSLLALGLSSSGLALRERLGVGAALAIMHVSWSFGFLASSTVRWFRRLRR